jgi:hypothetical protein
MTVVNLKLVAASLGPNSANAQWLLFEEDSSLAGWTMGIEAMWARDGSSFTLLRSLPEAKVYAVTMPGGPKTVCLHRLRDRSKATAYPRGAGKRHGG